MKLTKTQISALRRIRDGGPLAWCEGYGRAGGAISRMFDRLAKQGLCTKAPHKITRKGLLAISPKLRGVGDGDHGVE